jgi:hypothetical protein
MGAPLPKECYELARKMREEQGETYRAIGEHFGVSTKRARDMVEHNRKLQKLAGNWDSSFSCRTANCLTNYGWQHQLDIDSKEKLAAIYAAGHLYWNSPTKPRNWGKTSEREVCAVLGIEPSLASSSTRRYIFLARRIISLIDEHDRRDPAVDVLAEIKNLAKKIIDPSYP